MELKSLIKDRLTNVFKLLTSKRVEVAALVMLAGKFIVGLKETSASVLITALVCITILGCTYIVGETIRKS